MRNVWGYGVHGACLLANLFLLGSLLEWTGRGAPESNSDGSQALVFLAMWMTLNIASAATALVSQMEARDA